MRPLSLKALAHACSPATLHPVLKRIEASDLDLPLARVMFWSMAGASNSRVLTSAHPRPCLKGRTFNVLVLLKNQAVSPVSHYTLSLMEHLRRPIFKSLARFAQTCTEWIYGRGDEGPYREAPFC